MICIYEKNTTDFTSNGLGSVLPTECTVTETLNGTWELTMKHPLDADGKWQRLQRGNIIRAPVPAAMTPAIAVSATSSETKEIWRVSTNGGRLHLRSGTGPKYPIRGKYTNGAQVVLLCWVRRHLPALAEAIPTVNATAIPTAWPDDRFDIVWTFTLHPDAGRYVFGQVPQQLLPGDTDTPI